MAQWRRGEGDGVRGYVGCLRFWVRASKDIWRWARMESRSGGGVVGVGGGWMVGGLCRLEGGFGGVRLVGLG